MPELQRLRRDDVALREAAPDEIVALLGDPPLALLTGRRRFRVLAGSEVARDDDLDDVYNARVFGPNGELRWQREIGEPPTAALLLREAPAATPTGWRADLEPLLWTHEIEQCYLLCGKIVGSSAGKYRLHEARIGAFEIPASAVLADLDETLQLVSYELLGHSEGSDPNTRVFEELLSHIEASGEIERPRGQAPKRSSRGGN